MSEENKHFTSKFRLYISVEELLNDNFETIHSRTEICELEKEGLENLKSQIIKLFELFK